MVFTPHQGDTRPPPSEHCPVCLLSVSPLLETWLQTKILHLPGKRLPPSSEYWASEPGRPQEGEPAGGLQSAAGSAGRALPASLRPRVPLAVLGVLPASRSGHLRVCWPPCKDSSHWIRAHLYPRWPHLNYKHMQRSYFQIRSQSEALGGHALPGAGGRVERYSIQRTASPGLRVIFFHAPSLLYVLLVCHSLRTGSDHS